MIRVVRAVRCRIRIFLVGLSVVRAVRCRIRIFLVGLVLFGLPLSVLAVDEGDYETEMTQTVEPFCHSAGEPGELIGQDGIHIRYLRLRNPDAKVALVLVPGKTEAMFEYCEMAYDFYQLGYSIYSIDHRGQGLSQRMLPDPQKNHVEHFQDYVEDLETLLTQVVRPDAPEKVYAIGHSMGGAIVARHLESHPGAIDKAVLSAPMIEINTSPFPAAIARMTVNLLILFGKGDSFGPGQGPAEPESWVFADLPWTHSEKRFDHFKKLLVDNPELVVWGATNRWLKESLHVTREIRKQADKVQVPVLLLQAGLDVVVKPGGQNKFCSRAENCRKVELPTSYHQIPQESDTIRDRAVEEIRQFFSSDL